MHVISHPCIYAYCNSTCTCKVVWKCDNTLYILKQTLLKTAQTIEMLGSVFIWWCQWNSRWCGAVMPDRPSYSQATGNGCWLATKSNTTPVWADIKHSGSHQQQPSQESNQASRVWPHNLPLKAKPAQWGEKPSRPHALSVWVQCYFLTRTNIILIF